LRERAIVDGRLVVAELSEAIKLDEIESPSGDLMRNYGVIHNDMSSSFLSCNRNKRSLALDLKRPEALEIVHKLVGTADVVAYLWPEAISSLTFVGKESDPAKEKMGLDMIFKTKDRFITAGAVSDAEWKGMCNALAREDLIADQRFASVATRTKNIAERRAIIGEAKLDTAEILARLDKENVSSAPVLSRTDLLDDSQVAPNKTLEIIHDETLGNVRQPRPAARFDVTPASDRRMAPFLGEHSAAILEELGYSESEAGKVASSGVLAARRAA
jgi:crotonobetainyl-CoA:carnitine CoA-transferase CaiB-like acyl-CoA transferase